MRPSAVRPRGSRSPRVTERRCPWLCILRDVLPAFRVGSAPWEAPWHQRAHAWTGLCCHEQFSEAASWLARTLQWGVMTTARRSPPDHAHLCRLTTGNALVDAFGITQISH